MRRKLQQKIIEDEDSEEWRRERPRQLLPPEESKWDNKGFYSEAHLLRRMTEICIDIGHKFAGRLQTKHDRDYKCVQFTCGITEMASTMICRQKDPTMLRIQASVAAAFPTTLSIDQTTLNEEAKKQSFQRTNSRAEANSPESPAIVKGFERPVRLKETS